MAEKEFRIRIKTVADTAGINQAEKALEQFKESAKDVDAPLLDPKELESIKSGLGGVGEGIGGIGTQAGKTGSSLGGLAARFGGLAALGTAAIGTIATAWNELLKANPKVAKGLEDIGSTIKRELGETLKSQLEWLIGGDLEQAVDDLAESWGANKNQLEAASQASAAAQARSRDLQKELKKEAEAARDAAEALNQRTKQAQADISRAQQIADARREWDIATVDADPTLSEQDRIRLRQQIEDQYERERLERQKNDRQVEVAQQADEARLAREKALSDAQRAKTLEEYVNRKDSADQAVGSGKAAAAAAADEAFSQLSPELRDEIERINQDSKGNIAAFNKALADLLKRYIEAAEKSAREADHEAAEAAEAAREAAKDDSNDAVVKRLRDEAEAIRNAERIRDLDQRDQEKRTKGEAKEAQQQLESVEGALKSGESALQTQIDELAKLAPQGSQAAEQIAHIKTMLADGLQGREFEQISQLLGQWSQHNNQAIAGLAQSANQMVSAIASTGQIVSQLSARVAQLESQIRSIR